MRLTVTGVNFRTAPLALREALAFDKGAVCEALQAAGERFGCERALLSTCNRVELYLASADEHACLPSRAEILLFLAHGRAVAPDLLSDCLYHHTDAEAVRHLFRVACGLDSMVVGEVQIAGQVKQAYDVAQACDAVGPLLHALFQHARQVVRRVHTETALTQGKVSIPSLALDYLREVFDRFDDKTVLIVGAGKMGELTLRHLLALRPAQIVVTNRSSDKAEALAASCNGRAVPFAELDRALVLSDVVLSTTGACGYIVTRERMQWVLQQRRGRPLAILDLAVPRDFDPAIADLEGVDLLLNIDDLQAIRDRVLKHRCKEVPAAERIVAEERDRFLRNWHKRRSAPVIARIQEQWDAIRKQVQADCFQRLDGRLSEEDVRIIEAAFRQFQNKLLHTPLSVIHEEASTEGSYRFLELLARLFRLS